MTRAFISWYIHDIWKSYVSVYFCTDGNHPFPFSACFSCPPMTSSLVLILLQSPWLWGTSSCDCPYFPELKSRWLIDAKTFKRLLLLFCVCSSFTVRSALFCISQQHYVINTMCDKWSNPETTSVSLLPLGSRWDNQLLIFMSVLWFSEERAASFKLLTFIIMAVLWSQHLSVPM